MGKKRMLTDDAGSNGNEEERGKRSKSTLFITNLPYSFSSSDLEAAFSDVGPVRRCFMVTKKGSKDSRGFGFVQFAIQDDASRALQLKNGTEIGGRKARVELALLRHLENGERSEEAKGGAPTGSEKRKDDSKESGKENRKKTKQAKSEAHVEPNASFVETKKAISEQNQGNFNSKPTNSKEPWKYKGVKLDHGQIGNTSSLKSEAEAKCGDDESGKRSDGQKPAGKASEKQRVARTVVMGGLGSSLSDELCNSVKEIDPSSSINHPLPESELQLHGLTQDGCTKEACSVLFSSVRLARRAVEILHQKDIGGVNLWARQLGGEGSKTQKWRVIVRNLPFDVTAEEVKHFFHTAGFVWNVLIPISPEKGSSKGFCFVTFTCKKDAQNAISKLNGQKIRKRTVAIDWALPKNVYAGTTKSLDKPEEEDSSSEEEDDEDEMVDKEIDDDHGPEDNNALHNVDEAEVARKVLHNLISGSLEGETEKSTTIGSTPLPHNVEPEEDNRKRRKLTSDMEEKAPPNQEDKDLDKTIFISNLPFDIDHQEVKQHFSVFGKVHSYRPVLHKVTARPKGTAFLQFESPEGANAAVASTENAKGIVLRGRQLSVNKALNKKLAKEKEEMKKVREERDHRNLYLAKEGIIVRGSPAASGVSNEDMTKRESLGRKKAEKLQSPNFHVSRTRLIVYNVPKTMTAPELKKLFVEAVTQRATKQKPVIKQVKILKDDKKSTADVKPRQRGVAFVEFSEHQHALVALRVLNNNPETFGPERRPIVEFAVENIQVVKKRQEMANIQKNMGESVQPTTTEGYLERNHKLNHKTRKALGKKGANNVINADGEKGDEGINSRGNEESTRNRKTSKFRQKKGGNVPLTVKSELQDRDIIPKQRKIKGVHQEKGKHAAIGAESQGKRIMKRKREDDSSERSKEKKATKHKKDNKPELADKLDKLIAQYRAKISGIGKSEDKKKSSGATKRWFQ